MTSKRKLRAEIERLEGGWWSGFDFAIQTATGTRIADPAPWAAHLARVADAAREQGRREGYEWADGGDEGEYRRGFREGVLDALSLLDPQPLPESTPEPAGGCQGDVSPDAGCCGFACCCQHPPVAGWTPGSVTR